MSEAEEFAAFRRELQNEFDDFRKEINAEYVRFLSNAWEEFRLSAARTPDEVPKPPVPGISQEQKSIRKQIDVPDERVEKPVRKLPERDKTEERNLIRNSLGQKGDSLLCEYFGARLQLRYQHKQFFLSGIAEKSIGSLWKDLADSRFSMLLADMLRYKEEMQMNDWAYFLLTEKVAARLSTLHSEDCRTVFQHFFLVQSGYDARLARTEQTLVLLLPIREKVYNRPYLALDGKSYYIISKKKLKQKAGISTYRLPDKLVQRPYFSLAMDKDLRLPVQPKPFCIKDGKLEVKGEVNANKIRFYREYLSCELTVHARAVLESRLAKQVLGSLSAQLQGKPRMEALNLLLSWVQNGFNYQTDDEQFGYEKPFFIEEIFYYPACDCEDRSILFAYLAGRLFKQEVVLLDYPGHIATAVCLDKADAEATDGTYIVLKDKKYIVCDPTYINSSAGQAMPAYRNSRFKVIKL